MLRQCVDNLLVSIVLAFLLGAVAAFELSADLQAIPLILILLPFFLLFVVLAWSLSHTFRLLATIPFFLCVGLAHTHIALEPPTDPHHISHFIAEKKQVTLIGRVDSMVEFDGQKSRFLLRNEEILPHKVPPSSDTPLPARGLVQISMDGKAPSHVFPGASIMLLAQLRPTRSYQSPGAFNYRLYMASKDISCTGWVQSTKDILPLDDRTIRSPLFALRSAPEQMRQNSFVFLQQRFPQEIAGIFEALLIGSRVNISPAILENFKVNGCLHILAISGLHMSLLGLFSVSVLSFLLKRSRWLLLHSHVPTLALLLSAPILLLYAFLAGLNTPAVRALLTALLVLLAVSLKAQRSMLHLVSAAALIILAVQPLALFTASFQLSFSAVLAIIYIYPRLPLFRPYPPALADIGKVEKFFHKARIFLQSMLYISLAATVGTLPFLLYHFNCVSLIGPVMNLLLEPLLCFWALPCGLLALPLIDLAPDLAELILLFGAQAIRISLWLVEKTAAWSWSSIWTITPNFFEILLYFLILFLVFYPAKKISHYLGILCASGILLLSFSSITWRNNSGHEIKVDCIDVGQGNSTLIRLPSGSAILIDGGGYATSSFDPGKAVIAPFLWHQRLWRIDDVIVSHPHSDHYNGLYFILDRFRPRRLIVNNDSGREEDYHKLLAQAKRSQIEIVRVRADDMVKEEQGVQLMCLGMSGDSREESQWSTNDRSLVLRLQTPWHSFLFPGDITARAERILLHSGSELSGVDVLLAPHHGSRNSASPAFIEALSPKLIVVSSGFARQGTLPASEHLRSWHLQNIPYLITTEQGTISMTSGTDGLLIDTYLSTRHALSGVRKRLPCLFFSESSKEDGKVQDLPRI